MTGAMNCTVQNYNNTYAFGVWQDLPHYAPISIAKAGSSWCGESRFRAGRMPDDLFGAAVLRWNREKRMT
ncbi:YeeE/YedE family protein [Ahrensia sp. R2A130]|nr:YeeE/YedE family protein [Ahrensia sp. R2A130]